MPTKVVKHIKGFYFVQYLSMLVSAVTTNRPLVDMHGPVFSMEPPNTAVFANTKGASIDCTAFGVPAPRLEWIRKDGSAVTEIPRLVYVLPNNTLHFPPFPAAMFEADTHSQEYRCVATNKGGKILSRLLRVTAVVVDKDKTYNVQLNNVWVMRGGTAVLKCLINPRFVNEYIKVTGWTRGSESVNNNERISVTSNGELQVRDVRDSDRTSAYHCVTKNILTLDEKTSPPAYIHLYDPPAVWKAPNIENSPSSLSGEQYGKIELPCVATGNPLPQYEWSKSEKIVKIDGNKFEQRGGNLLIYNLTGFDGGHYKCTTKNKEGASSVSIQLIVTSALLVSLYPSDQVVDAGRAATFNCSIQGSPVKEITWYHNGQPLTNSSRVHTKIGSWLQIPAVNRNDQGMYQCIVGNDVEMSQATGQLLLGAAHPAFLDTFQVVYLKPGSNVTFRCSVSGNPTPTIRWTLDDEPVESHDRMSVTTYTTEQADVISTLVVRNIQVQTGGEYRCIGSNAVGEVRHMARANVYGVPYVRVLQNITATANQPLIIKCYVSGYPVGIVTWFKDAQVLPINHRQRVQNGTLTVDNVQKFNDDGEYTCTAANVKGEGMSRNVIVRIVEPPTITPFSFQKRTREGQRVTVICVISSGELPIVVGWLKDDQPLVPDLGVNIQQSGPYSSLLFINKVSPRHNGNYTCFANNSVGYDNYTSSLIVFVPPRWIVDPKDSFVVLGESVQINCMADGTPVPTVIWQKAKGQIPGDYININYSLPLSTVPNRLRLLSNGSLLITVTEETDMGYYLCRASNGIGYPLSKMAHLTVHIPARYSDNNQKNYTVKRSENTTLECSATGDTPIFVTWRFGSDTINSQLNPRMRVEHIDTTSRLHVTSAKREDSGVYVCHAENKYGFGETIRRLVVVEPPERPIALKMESRTSKSVNVSWKEPYNGNSQITAYVLQYKNISDLWQIIPSNVTIMSTENLTADILGLHPSYKYHVRAMAVNAIGVGQPSDEITVLTDEEAPSGPPTDVRVQASGSTSLKLTWRPTLYEHQNGKIIGYEVGLKQHNTSEVYEYTNILTENNSDLELQVKNLLKFTRYDLHVRAYNGKGQGPMSSDVTAFTLEDVPSLPPQDVQARAVSSTGIEVSWAESPYYTIQGVLQGYKVLYKEVRLDEDESGASYMKVSKFRAVLNNLKKYTNYSIEVLAYTKMGEGARSAPLYVRTNEDVPSRPSSVKAVIRDRNSVKLLWEPPQQHNGIMSKYIIRYSNSTDGSPNKRSRTIELKAIRTSHVIGRLQEGHEYLFTVTALTSVGEGDPTLPVKAIPTPKVPARILNFSGKRILYWKESTIIKCGAIGMPTPVFSWKMRGKPLFSNKRVHILQSGSLKFENVQKSDAANYTCRAENKFGTDEIVITVTVKVKEKRPSPPIPPHLMLASTTSSTIQINWKSSRNGGSPIKGFYIKFKKEHGEWQTLKSEPRRRTHTFTGLKCGTGYRFLLNSFNEIGVSSDSSQISAKTNGSSPLMPPQDLLVQLVNTTSIKLDLTTWSSAGCPITFYTVKYRLYGDTEWVEVSNHVDGNMTSFTVLDLRPATWYVMKMTAHNEAGSTDSLLKFGTLTDTGSTILPLFVVHRKEGKFYEKIYVMLPLCTGIVVILIAAVAFLLWCRRRSERLRFKEFHLPKTASNLRRDITAETSLMNDLDKHLNLDMDSGGGTMDPYGKHNLNLRTASQSEEVECCGIVGGHLGAAGSHHASWLLHATFPGRTGTNKTASDSGSPTRSGSHSHHWTSSKSSYTATTTTATSRYPPNAVPSTDYRSPLHATLAKDCTTAYASVEIDQRRKLLGPPVSSSSSSSSPTSRFPVMGTVRRWPPGPPVLPASGSHFPSAAATTIGPSQHSTAKIHNRLSLRSHQCTPRPIGAHNSFAASYDFIYDDANPYATINQLSISINTPKSGLRLNSHSSDEDTVALEKSAAQRQTLGPPVKLRNRPPCPISSTVSKPPRKKKEQFENKGVTKSPRKYASADQLNTPALSNTPRPQSDLAEKLKARCSSSEKGSQRHSVISSVTTVSSSRDELVEAYENAKRAQLAKKVVYESHHDSSSQPTDSSSATEPGIREFTQSPPKPDERREASCEVPPYELREFLSVERRYRKQVDAESDTTECEMTHPRDRSPPRRARGRHKGKQKGQVVGKRNLGIIPRTHSRISTTSTNSEEVTYAFCGSPTESYPPLTRETRTRPELEINPPCSFTNASIALHSTFFPRNGVLGGRATPHTRVRYGVKLDTMGSDECKPLVPSLAHTSTATPSEQDSISLLDRHYRPVKDTGLLGPDSPTRLASVTLKKDYTADFTIV